ncbi:MAG: NADH-quinone oxidoreductase subunit NuoK [Bacteroidota bacterium]
MISVEHYFILSALLFAIGLAIVIVKKNAIVVLMGVELILNAANINFVAVSQYDKGLLQGQFFTLFVIVIAAAEAAVALAIVVKTYQYFGSIDLDKIDELKG